MKTSIKFLCAFLFCSVLFSTNSYSQEFRNVIKTNPVGLAFGNFNVTYEKVLDTKSSLLFDAQYMYQLFGTDIKAGGLGLAYRYYFTHAKREVPTGFYVNPQLSYSFGNLEDSNAQKQSFGIFGIGAEIGYQWAWDSGFTLDLGIGPNYSIITGDVGDSFDKTSGILPSATVAVGFAF